ncbi:MAG: hypothetical protein IVW36_05525 [Dehalococcoidia bacterium]|nr:hypothetical protein [Dehalococcoidia bacterium]
MTFDRTAAARFGAFARSLSSRAAAATATRRLREPSIRPISAHPAFTFAGIEAF